jgi:hypothetical protein
MTVVSFTLVVEVDDNRWANLYGVGDGYDRAEAQPRRSLVADVEDYITNQVTQSAAADEDAILSVAVVHETPR